VPLLSAYTAFNDHDLTIDDPGSPDGDDEVGEPRYIPERSKSSCTPQMSGANNTILGFYEQMT
jgi:hypothetical protein